MIGWPSSWIFASCLGVYSPRRAYMASSMSCSTANLPSLARLYAVLIRPANPAARAAPAAVPPSARLQAGPSGAQLARLPWAVRNPPMLMTCADGGAAAGTPGRGGM